METILGQTETISLLIGNDGIVRMRARPGTYEVLETARENLALCRELLDDKKTVAIVDISETRGASMEARKYYASDILNDCFFAVAMIIKSPLSRVLGNFMMSMYKMDIPAKLFTSEDEAVGWLKQFQEITTGEIRKDDADIIQVGNQ